MKRREKGGILRHKCLTEPGRNDDIGDDATHNVDAIGQAYAVQSTVPGGRPHTGAVGQQIAPARFLSS